jgi:hypothetical protein
LFELQTAGQVCEDTKLDKEARSTGSRGEIRTTIYRPKFISLRDHILVQWKALTQISQGKIAVKGRKTISLRTLENSSDVESLTRGHETNHTLHSIKGNAWRIMGPRMNDMGFLVTKQTPPRRLLPASSRRTARFPAKACDHGYMLGGIDGSCLRNYNL